MYKHVIKTIDVSIHAPAKEATIIPKACLNIDRVSIHAPAKEATGFVPYNKYLANTFQSTPPRRRRQFVF